MIRTQLFVKYYIILNSDSTVDKKLFSQNFWYARTQLVLKRKPNAKHLPNNCLETWSNFSEKFNVAYEMLPKVNGYSYCATATCIEMATTYAIMFLSALS